MNTPTKKSPRALPCVWARFFRLPQNAHFYLTTTKTAVKTSFCTASVHLTLSPKQFVNPFRRVRTTTLVRDARPGGKSSYAPTVEETPRVEQPHSDNNVTGPTS